MCRVVALFDNRKADFYLRICDSIALETVDFC